MHLILFYGAIQKLLYTKLCLDLKLLENTIDKSLGMKVAASQFQAFFVAELAGVQTWQLSTPNLQQNTQFQAFSVSKLARLQI